MEEEKTKVTNECWNCFYLETTEEPVSSTRQAKPYLCQFCHDHPKVQMNHELRLGRILEILHQTEARRGPDALRLMYKVLMDKIMENQDERGKD